MRNIKMTLSYDGTNYHGFQVQNRTGLKTIQGTLEKALSLLTKEEISVIGSGRTDAGVHARGQVINFTSQSRIPAERFPLAVNSVLPADIVVWEARDVEPAFHARFQAIRKTYQYKIYNESYFSPFWRHYAYHVPVSLDLEGMAHGAASFLGTHDFRGFCAKDTAVQNFVRTIYSFTIEKEGPIIKFSVTGDGFLYNMVRIMVGTLLEIGLRKRNPQEIPSLLAAGDRRLAGTTIPPQGLYLISVEY